MKRVVLVLFLLLLGICILYNCDPIQYKVMPKCPTKTLIGLSCPGCGIQRAIHEMLHGNMIEAIKYNYYLIISGPYALLFCLVWMMPKKAFSQQIKTMIENKYVVNSFVASFVVWFMIRNVLNI